jgi:membrane-bound metal-dependent hydrolase YbcI (DUF457 family)
MGPGHLGVGFAAKAIAPKAPLWSLLIASEALDLLSAVTLTAGVEKAATYEMNFSEGLKILTPGVIPWSHGLFMTLVWSLLFGAIAYLFLKDRRAGMVLGLVVFSHWILDFLVHIPDLPLLFADSPKVGLGLWGSGPGLIVSLVLELMLLGGGVLIYVRWRKQRRTSEEM